MIEVARNDRLRRAAFCRGPRLIAANNCVSYRLYKGERGKCHWTWKKIATTRCRERERGGESVRYRVQFLRTVLGVRVSTTYASFYEINKEAARVTRNVRLLLPRYYLLAENRESVLLSTRSVAPSGARVNSFVSSASDYAGRLCRFRTNVTMYS